MKNNKLSRDRFPGRNAAVRRMSLALFASAALSAGLVQPAAAALVTGSSWSYVSDTNDQANPIHEDSQSVPENGLFSTTVNRSIGNYAKSAAGISGGALIGKIAVGTAYEPGATISMAYSRSHYREGWVPGEVSGCGADYCGGTVVPNGVALLTVRLGQTGVFTPGAANFGVSYFLGSYSDSISFTFSVSDEVTTGNLPFGYAASLNGTAVEVDFTPVYREVAPGVYQLQHWRFAYSVVDSVFYNNPFWEELSLSGHAWGGGTQYYDSYHSFEAVLSTDAPYLFTSDSGRQIGTAGGGGTAPEPGSLYLLGAGLLGLARLMKRGR